MVSIQNWSEKYRPQCFEHVAGQSDTVEFLRALVRKKPQPHILFAGPYGTGKTTLARLYAKAINCKAPKLDSSPCGVCSACDHIEAGYRDDYMEYNSRTDVDIDEIRRLKEEVLSVRPMGDLTTRVFFFDEARGLSNSVVDGLLTLLQGTAYPAVFLFAALDRGHLSPALVSRCQRVETKVLDEKSALAFLNRLSEAERLRAEPGALELVAQVSAHGRDLATNLERVAASGKGHITVHGVQQALVNDRVARMVSYFLTLADGDLNAQLRTIAASTLLPMEVLETIQQMLTYLRLRYVGPEVSRMSQLYRFLDLMREEDCLRIVAAFRERAEAVQVPFVVLFDEMLEFWAYAPPLITSIVLNIQLVRFHDLVNAHRYGAERGIGAEEARPAADTRAALASALSERDGDAAMGSSRRFRRSPNWRRKAMPPLGTGTANSAIQDLGGAPAEHLSEEQVEDLYEAATFMVQKEGVLFNALITLNWDQFGIKADQEAADLTSRLAHQLGLRLSNWGLEYTTAFHRISLHERVRGAPSEGGGLCSHLVAHIPAHHEKRLEAWVRGKFLPRRLPNADTSEKAVHIELGPSKPQQGHVARHWALMRLLWRGLDQSVTVDMKDGTKSALVNVLKIPERQQGSIGKVTCRRFTVSETINVGSRKAAAEECMGHLSVFADAGPYGRAVWAYLDRGWELKEHAERACEINRRRSNEDKLRTAFWSVENKLYSSAYSLRMKALRESWPADPHSRLRNSSWGWWQQEMQTKPKVVLGNH